MHHAEVVAHRVGEPFGSLVLAVAVTVIEVGADRHADGLRRGQGTSTLARDTVFAAVMITMNGIVGLAPGRRAGGTTWSASTPRAPAARWPPWSRSPRCAWCCRAFTTCEPGPRFSSSQLVFAAVVSLPLYGLFVFTQTVRHRDFFLPVGHDGSTPDDARARRAADRDRRLVSLGLLLVALVAVVGLAKVESPAIEDGVAAARLPAVVRRRRHRPAGAAARSRSPRSRGRPRNRIQISLNLAYGSAMACDRPDHPDHRGGLDLARPARWRSASSRCRSCCWC